MFEIFDPAYGKPIFTTRWQLVAKLIARAMRRDWA
jgi:hypothetical protein